MFLVIFAPICHKNKNHWRQKERHAIILTFGIVKMVNVFDEVYYAHTSNIVE